MEKGILVVLGALLAWAFYFIRRRIEHRRTAEIIARSRDLLALKDSLQDSGTRVVDLRRFESGLVGKAHSAVELADDCLARAEEVVGRGAVELLHDDAFTAHARERLVFADARLHRVASNLRGHLDADGVSAFDRAHRAWVSFRDRHAAFIAQTYARGPIRSLIEVVTLESLTAAWTAELQTQLAEAGDPAEIVGP